MKTISQNIILIIFAIFILTGCSISQKNEHNIEDKIVQEIEYLEDSIFNITNRYAKGEYIKNEKLDWTVILEDEKKINNVLETIILDFSELDISNDEIIKLSNELNSLLLATSSENEIEFLQRLNNLYALLPNYLKSIQNSEVEVKDKELKSMVLAGFSLASTENWDESKRIIQEAINKYNEMMNNVDYMQKNSYKLNKTYILLGELKNAIDIESIDLVKLKFVNFIEKV